MVLKTKTDKKKEQKPQTIAMRIFRVMLALTIILTMFFSVVNAVYTFRVRAMQAELILSMTQNVHNGILEPLHQITDETTMTATEGNAKAINRFFTTCQSTVEMLGIAAERVYKADEPAKQDIMLPTMDSKDTIYRLNAKGFDITNSESRHVLEVMSRLRNVMEANYQTNQDAASIYFASTAGFTIIADNQAAAAIDEHGSAMTFDAESRDWYIAAVEAGEPVFSSVKTDYFTGEGMVTCSMPVYAGGKLLGVAAIDIRMSTLNDYLSTNSVKGAVITLVDGEGNVELSSSEAGLFGLKPDEQKNLYDCGLPTLNKILENAAKGETGKETYTLSANGEELTEYKVEDLKKMSQEEVDAYVEEALDSTNYEVYYAPIPLVGWSTLFVADYSELNAQSQKMITDFLTETTEQLKSTNQFLVRAMIVILIVFGVLVLVLYFIAKLVSKRLSEPIEELTDKVQCISGDNLDFTWDRTDTDETAVLAQSFSDMTKKIRQYIEDLTTVTAEKERISAELDVARRIQADMLPLDFPDQKELKLYASMTPAKEVGGDFYDFFFIDEDHLGLVMADVSGKGVPAALFMVIAKTLIKNLAVSENKGAAEILSMANKLLCEGNEEMLFVTVWIGILTISTGEMDCANAGHEYPIIKRLGETYQVYEDKHAVPLAVVETVKFKEYQMTLQPGDVLVLYTDGFPESTNEEEELFSLERMLTAMNAAPKDDPKALDDHVREEIAAFIGTAVQFDDMTMLTLCYYGNNGEGNNHGAETE